MSAELIRSLEPEASSPGRGGGGGGALREGSKVEARYRGKSKYYPGVIRRENRDGTFDVDYDDVRAITAFLLTHMNRCKLYLSFYS